MVSKQTAGQDGFSLIEAMIALVILGIAAVSLVRAVESHIDTMYALERRAAAQWVAENALAEASLGSSGSVAEVEMLGWRWRVRTTLGASEDPDLLLAAIRVSAAGEPTPIVTLRGFVDRGTITQ